jgi:hypothetical protein
VATLVAEAGVQARATGKSVTIDMAAKPKLYA